MLRTVKVPGASTAHNYPRIQLSYMLVLEYLRQANHVSFDLMDGHMYLFNEEYGEIYFSMLSRCVLGDHYKSKFDYMDSKYRLLPIYQQVKDDIITETSNNSGSILWRHTIPAGSQEVVMTTVFFQRLISNIIGGNHKSYPYKQAYGPLASCSSELNTNNIPVVFNTNMTLELDNEFNQIKKSVQSNWMQDKADLWPEVKDGNFEDAVDMQSDDDIDVVRGSDHEVDDWLEPDWGDCIIGTFAVVRRTFDDGSSGVDVYKIFSKNASDSETNSEMMSFVGVEYRCHILNNQLDCLTRGRWNYHQSGNQRHTNMNWSVITYFEKLDSNRCIPPDIVQHINDTQDIGPMFRSAPN